MTSSGISFLSDAEKLTFGCYHYFSDKSKKSEVKKEETQQLPLNDTTIKTLVVFQKYFYLLTSEVLSRLFAATLSLAAVTDFVFHTLLIFPTFMYSVGKSIYQRELDFIIPWQHIQRVRNSVAPIFLGSMCGIIHPFFGIAMCEPTDKHAVIGMLSSNIGKRFSTPCSPIHTLAIIEDVAKNNRFAKHQQVEHEIFSQEQIQILKETKGLESSLSALQAQEFIHKITNLTLYIMNGIWGYIADEKNRLNPVCKHILLRTSGLFIPILTVIDMTIILLIQTFFLISGSARLISGRGPMYTEVTTNPLMQLSFLVQNILKAVGNMLGTIIWFIDPMSGFKISLVFSNLFFKLQMNIVLLQIRWKLYFSKKNERFVIPIVFGVAADKCTALSMPTDSMHMTYLIVEKKEKTFDLYWVNRPAVSSKKGVDSNTALDQIRNMLDIRFPFMDYKKLIEYPFKIEEPTMPDSKSLSDIDYQGNATNCVPSNAFGMLEIIDTISKKNDIAKLRYATVRKSLMNDYSFYKNDFFSFNETSENSSLKSIWDEIEKNQDKVI